MKFFLILALIVLSIATEVTQEDGVLVLTDSNFDAEIAKHEFILVEFYAPWCGHCKKLAPEYSRAAKHLSSIETPVPLAKVEATENKNIANRYDIKGFPSLKFFVKG